jgi:hypothetical protein
MISIEANASVAGFFAVALIAIPPCAGTQAPRQRRGVLANSRLGVDDVREEKRVRGHRVTCRFMAPRTVWCGRPESNRHGLAPNGFSYHYDFRRRPSAFVVWTIPSP